MIKSILKNRAESSLVFYFTMYLLTTFIVNILLISIVAFFHFLLDHNISIIENWINRNSWEIVIISKILSLFITIKTINLKSYRDRKFFDILKVKSIVPERKALIVTVFSIFMYAAFLKDLKLNPQSSFYFYLQILSFVGNSLFYLLDVFAIMFIVDFLQLNNLKNSFRIIVIISILNTVISVGIIPTIGYASILIFVNTFIVLKLFTVRNIGNVITYLIFHVSISSLLWGLDLIWKDSYSIYKNTNISYVLLPVVVWAISFIYLVYTRGHESSTVD